MEWQEVTRMLVEMQTSAATLEGSLSASYESNRVLPSHPAAARPGTYPAGWEAACTGKLREKLV